MATMTPLSEPVLYDSPMEMLREMVAALNECNEGFLDGKTIPQLLNIYHCWTRCGWDIYPDEWTLRQINEAMQGICPDWEERRGQPLKPVFRPDRRETRRVTAFQLVEQEEE